RRRARFGIQAGGVKTIRWRDGKSDLCEDEKLDQCCNHNSDVQAEAQLWALYAGDGHQLADDETQDRVLHLETDPEHDSQVRQYRGRGSVTRQRNQYKETIQVSSSKVTVWNTQLAPSRYGAVIAMSSASACSERE